MSVIDRLQVDRGVFGGVFGLTDREDLTIGYERVVEEHWLPGSGEEDLTNAERVEIADAVIARWQAWRAKWVEKLASDAKHAARVEEARAAMQAGDWARFSAMVREDMAAEGVVEVVEAVFDDVPVPATQFARIFDYPGFR